MRFNWNSLSKFCDRNFDSIIFYIFLIFIMFFRFNFFFAERLWSDEGLYCWFGKRIFTDPSLIFSKEITSHHPPLFAVFLALGHIFLPSALACHLIPFIFYGMGIVAIYSLGTRIKNKLVGLFSALILAVNGYYFYYSTFIFIDVPLAVFFIILAVLLEGIDEDSPPKKHFLLGLWAVLTLLLKSSAIIIIPWIFFYYLLSFNKIPLLERIKKFLMPFSLMSMLILFLSIKNYSQLGGMLPYGPQLSLVHIKDFGASLRPFIDVIQLPSLWLFIIIGLIAMREIERKKKILLLSWFFITGAGIYSISALIEIRFVLLILPSLVIIIALALEKIVVLLAKRNFRFRHFILVVVLIALFIFSSIFLIPSAREIKKSDKFYVGYYLAGEYVRQMARPDSLILAGSERQIRYTSDINFKEYGGQIIAFRQNQEEFEELVQRSSHAILEIDAWEVLQPKWAFPVASPTLNYLGRQGFKIVNIIYSQSDEMGEIPIIYIFER